MLREGAEIDRRYIIHQFLCHGPYADVYSGRLVRGQQRVAVKLLYDSVTLRLPRLADYLFGSTTLANDEVAGVTRVLDRGIDGARHFVVEEWIDGPFLSDDWLRTTGPWAARRVASHIRALAEVLESLHAKGVVHGDVRLENLYVDREHLALRLHNIGLARIARPKRNLTQTRDVAGLAATGLHLLAGGPPAGLTDGPSDAGLWDILEETANPSSDGRLRATTLRNCLGEWLETIGPQETEPAVHGWSMPVAASPETEDLALLLRVAGLSVPAIPPESERLQALPTTSELIDQVYEEIDGLRARVATGDEGEDIRPALDAAVARLRVLQREEAAEYEAAVAESLGFDPEAALEILEEAQRVVNAHRATSS